jgi:SAM-dependent methyltransferase
MKIDYSSTVSNEAYISGIKVHVWLAAMYELMIQRVVREVKKIATSNTFALTVLDVGCGPGHFTLDLAHAISKIKLGKVIVRVVGVDRDKDFIDFATSKLRRESLSNCSFLLSDLTSKVKIPPAHIITTSGFFHHFTEDEKPLVMKQVASLLISGGILIDGDEHPAPEKVYAKACVGKNVTARQSALCALYFQVIDGAQRIHHADLLRTEIENLFAELYRDYPHKPSVNTAWLIEMVTTVARDCMYDVIQFGIQSIPNYTHLLLEQIDKKSKQEPREEHPNDRGDYKDTLTEHMRKLETAGLVIEKIYDTGNYELLGSAPVLVCRKK